MYRFVSCCCLYFLLQDVIATTSDEACLSLLFMGDWGSDQVKKVTPFLTEKENAHCAQGKKAASGLFLLGDNFYPDGVSSVDDPLWERYFLSPFKEVNTSMYVIAGNHDHHQKDIHAQLEFQDPRWHFPSPYYAVEFRENDLSILAIQLDTWDLVGGNSEAGTDIVDKEQFKWLRLQLEKSKQGNYDYVIVNGHYPIRSVGGHGDVNALVNEIVPLLQKYEVSAYLFGHDHILQLLKEDGLVYVGSGVGGRKEGPIHDTNRASYQSGEHYGYVSIAFTKSKMNIQFHQIIHHESVITYEVNVEGKRTHRESNLSLLRMKLQQALLLV